MRRIPSCIGLDLENKKYLEAQDVSAAEFINSLIKKYRESKEVRDVAGKIEEQKPDPIDSAVINDIKGTIQVEDEDKIIRDYLLSDRGMLYNIKLKEKRKERVIDRGFLADLKIAIAFTPAAKGKQFSTARITKVLREVVDAFDDKAYVIEHTKDLERGKR